MARIEFDLVNEAGERHRVVAGQADIIAMERKFDIGASALATNARHEWVAFLAYNAAKRTGATSLDFDSWIEEFEVEEYVAPKE